MTTAFGPIVSGGDVRAAVVATIQTWAATYTAEIARQKGITLPPIRTYGVGAGPTYPPDELPACIIVAPGLLGAPEYRGDGSLDVQWGVGVGIVVADPTRDAAIATAEAYTAALRALILQQSSLGGFATETVWTDEETTQIAWELDRVIAAGSLQFSVSVRSVVNRHAGLLTPPPDPAAPSTAPAVAATGITIIRTAT